MEIVHWQYLGAALQNPAFTLDAIAGWAVAVSTTVPSRLHMPTIGTGFRMATQCGGTALLQSGENTFLSGCDLIVLLQLITKGFDGISNGDFAFQRSPYITSRGFFTPPLVLSLR